LPNVHYSKNAPLITEYKNLRSQCVFTLADLVNNHKIAVKTQDTRIKEQIIEELALYQDASKGDAKRMATEKDIVKDLLGRSPDISDTLIMRMYFVVREKIKPNETESLIKLSQALNNQFARNTERLRTNSTK